MEVLTLTRGDVLASNCHVIRSGGCISVVDPSVGYGTLLERMPKAASLECRYVILTHAHIDHFWEIGSYVERGFRVLVSAGDADKLSDPRTNCSLFIYGPIKAYNGEFTAVSEGEVIDLGEESVEVIEVPGHTSGSICLVGNGVIFSGDTLFAGGAYGRYDLPSGDPEALVLSIRRILEYPDGCLMYSGHGEATTLEKVKKYF